MFSRCREFENIVRDPPSPKRLPWLVNTVTLNSDDRKKAKTKGEDRNLNSGGTKDHTL